MRVCPSLSLLSVNARSLELALPLRRFQMFDSSATRPYTVSAMACWKRAAELGYMTLDNNAKVHSTQVCAEEAVSYDVLVSLERDFELLNPDCRRTL